MFRNFAFILFAASLIFASSSVCYGSNDEDTVQIIQLKTVLDQIPGLTWSAKTAKIEVIADPQGEKYVVSVSGKFTSEDWTLLSDASQIPVSEKKEIVVKIPIVGESSAVDLLGISPLGVLKREKIGAYFPGWKAFIAKKKAPTPVIARRFFFTPSLGVTLVKYEQSGMSSFTETALTGKFSGLYYLAPRWDIGLTTFFTLLPMTSTVPESKIRFLGVNGRVGYVLPFVKAPWRLSLMTGVYFTTTFVPGSTFGFENMAGPQLFPVLTRVWGSGKTATFYFKFSPVTNRLTPLALANREMAGGGAYGFRLKNGHLMSISLDIASMKLDLENTQLNATTYSLGLGYAL